MLIRTQINKFNKYANLGGVHDRAGKAVEADTAPDEEAENDHKCGDLHLEDCVVGQHHYVSVSSVLRDCTHNFVLLPCTKSSIIMHRLNHCLKSLLR